MSVADDLSAPKRALLQRRLSGKGRQTTPQAIGTRAPGEVVPISTEQKNVWLHAAMAPDVPLYNEALTIHRHGSFDCVALERSIRETLRRHEIWRTSFRMVDGELRQIVHPDLQIAIPLDDLTHLPEPEREGAALDIATADAQKPFDLAQAPLFRARIVRMAPDNHRLYLALHHIIFDGVSIYRIILPQLAMFYAAYADGREPDGSPPPLQYGDYTLWREHEIEHRGMEREIGYWRETLSGELPVLRLPGDRARPTRSTHCGGMETFQISAALTAALKSLSRQEGVTFYVVLLAAFKALLHRYSGQEDIIIGSVTDMRRRPELAGTVGYFLNSLALRTRPGSELPFRSYLGHVQDAVLGALDASTVPFDRVVREVQPRRDDGRHPIFQVLFSIEPPPPALDAGWDMTQMDFTVGIAKFDLYLELDERPDGLIGRFLYSTDVFDAPTIRRMIGHWTRLLESAVADPECALSRLPLFSAQERRDLSNVRNGPVRAYPEMTLPEWFDGQALRKPDATAVECEGRKWSYRDLRERVLQLEARLECAGCGRECLVGIMLERGFDMVAGLLAILRCGAAYLPLDPALPLARLAMLLEDARPSLVLTESTHCARISQTDARIVLCDGHSEAWEQAAPEMLPRCVPDDAAYVLYTSGSTGRPKAVEIAHRSLANLLRAMVDELEPSDRAAWLAVTTLSFDIAALELFLPLVTGGRLVIATREEASDPVMLKALIDRSHCTIMQATPATWRGLLAADWSGPSNLKILCGGEALPHELAMQLLKHGSGLWNMYGPTETTIWSLIHKVQPGEDPVPIGRPLANTTTFVLDSRGEPVPNGVAGELWIGGPGLARGYRGDPLLTQQKFCTAAEWSSERLYRTGDVVRVRNDGLLEFLGRVDNQVKIRGFRVGLEEVEAAIADCPEVAAASVRAWPDASGELNLVAYVVPTSERNVSHLAGFVENRLPRYMIPPHFVVLDALPMTANGKVDRARLPMPAQIRNQPVSEPRDALERTLAEAWHRVLGLSSVGIHDNFFELGGHSLLTAMLAGEIKKTTGRELPLASLFRAPTIASQADLLRSDEEPPFSHLVALRKEGTRPPLFLVHALFGNVLQYLDLAGRLQTDRPIYGLQARGADTRQAPHQTVAEMAAAYLDDIRAVQPQGPYALAGYSFGGLIAYEMACRLREAGEQVDLLALIETNVYYRNLLFFEWLSYQWSLVGRVGCKLKILPIREWPSYLLTKFAMIWHRLFLRLESIDPIPPSQQLPEAVIARNREMWRICVREFFAYRPRRFAGRISVFNLAEGAFDLCDPLPLWRRLALGVDVFTISGTHGTIMDDPNVNGLALQLNRCLAQLDSGADTRIQKEVLKKRDRDEIAIGSQALGEPDFAH
ncbi:MAG TPA: amino acid adenylation domain-containing protein [Rhizomicrobium sp.]|jgi:amino acid adenylation domain-containing protein